MSEPVTRCRGNKVCAHRFPMYSLTFLLSPLAFDSEHIPAYESDGAGDLDIYAAMLPIPPVVNAPPPEPGPGTRSGDLAAFYHPAYGRGIYLALRTSPV